MNKVYWNKKHKTKVYWNQEYETYEYVHADGYVEVFRDDIEAKKFAEKNNLEFDNTN